MASSIYRRIRTRMTGAVELGIALQIWGIQQRAGNRWAQGVKCTV